MEMQTETMEKKPKCWCSRCSLPPEFIVAEILWRLPIKALLRFRSVCKLWNSVIASDPQFAILQLKNSQKNISIGTGCDSCFDERKRVVIWDSRDYSSTFVLVKKNPFGLRLRNNNNNNEEDDDCCSSSSSSFAIEKIPSPIKDNSYLIAASCDGLVCIRQKRSNSIFFWNPLTGATNEGALEGGPVSLTSRSHYGIGYDSSTDDYKLVWIYSLFANLITGSPRTEVGVYSLRTNSWRQIEDFPPWQVCCEQSGVFVNGSLYWPVRSEGSPKTYKLASFDLATEKFGFLDMPEAADFRLHNCRIEMAILGGKLGLYYASNKKDCYNLLLVNVHDNGESWAKYTVGVTNGGLFYPLCLLKNGEEVLMQARGIGFALYHLKDSTVRFSQSMPTTFQAMAITETLISPTTFKGRNK